MTSEEMRRLHAETTPGEWSRGPVALVDQQSKEELAELGPYQSIQAGDGIPPGRGFELNGYIGNEDARFIVAAHNEWIALLDRLDRYEAALREISGPCIKSGAKRQWIAQAALEGK